MTTWRLVIDDPTGGAWNMAVDRAILDSHEAGGAPPTLRLYRWSRPTVSLGRFQDVADVDLAVCDEHGIGLCRRPTGGRGVLHDDEITYSLVAGLSDGVPRGVRASYRMLCGALLEAYRDLGLPASLTARPRGERGAGACYLHSTQADLSLGGAKLSGSAQVWRAGSCLQHGSFVICRDVPLEARVFRLDAGGAAALADTTQTIVEALGTRPPDDVLVEAIVGGIGRGLGVTFERADLRADELSTARRVVGEYEILGAPRDVRGRESGQRRV